MRASRGKPTAISARAAGTRPDSISGTVSPMRCRGPRVSHSCSRAMISTARTSPPPSLEARVRNPRRYPASLHPPRLARFRRIRVQLASAANSGSRYNVRVANRAYLKVWCREVTPESLPQLIPAFLHTVPFSRTRPAFTQLVLRAVETAETPLIERDLRAAPYTPAEVM